MQYQARKRFGQNFLIDERIIEQIVQTIQPQANQHLVEIGPGMGALTSKVLAMIGKMDVVELDRDLLPILNKNCTALGELHIHQADALQFDFKQLHRKGKLRIIGNLPYNISTPLIFHLLEQIDHIQDMHFMLQKEVVDRLAASTGSKAYGRLSVMMQYYCQVEALFEVPPSAFSPPPKVDSAIVRLTPHAAIQNPVDDIKQLETLLKAAFQQRRKTLKNNLKKLITAEQLEQLGVDPSLRPEQIELKDYVKMSNSLAK